MDTTILHPDKGLIFRIVHRGNLGWIIQNGLRSQNSGILDPGFIGIGDPDLIGKRRSRAVDGPPGGTLADYVSFYFTPRSPMLNKILTGHGGTKRHTAFEILVLVSSLPRLGELSVPYLFTNGHAFSSETRFSSQPDDLQDIDWTLLRASDFKRDSDDPGKLVRYQAEALVRDVVPWKAVIGIGCSDHMSCENVRQQVMGRMDSKYVVTRPDWFPR